MPTGQQACADPAGQQTSSAPQQPCREGVGPVPGQHVGKVSGQQACILFSSQATGAWAGHPHSGLNPLRRTHISPCLQSWPVHRTTSWARASPGMKVRKAPAMAAPINRSARPLESVPLASPLASLSKECSGWPSLALVVQASKGYSYVGLRCSWSGVKPFLPSSPEVLSLSLSL